MATSPAFRKRASAAALAAVVGGFAVVPFALSWRRSREGAEPLTTQHRPLVGHQLMRGAYNNYGSRDAGADPDWVTERGTLVWKGKGGGSGAASGGGASGAGGAAEGVPGGFAPSEADLREARARLNEKLRARGLPTRDDGAR
jgi:hypothetical protein